MLLRIEPSLNSILGKQISGKTHPCLLDGVCPVPYRTCTVEFQFFSICENGPEEMSDAARTLQYGRWHDLVASSSVECISYTIQEMVHTPLYNDVYYPDTTLRGSMLPR